MLLIKVFLGFLEAKHNEQTCCGWETEKCYVVQYLVRGIID